MHLLNVNTYQLEGFFGSVRPSYAILSHTWGEDETSYQDLQAGRKRGPGWTKIEACCRQAVKDSYDYVWIDTCCIEKSSSAELSEAINSMYQWYRNSEICYVHMSDVPSDASHSEQDSAFRKSRWFSWGWTLQEFLAPDCVQFFDQSWNACFDHVLMRFGSDDRTASLVRLLSEITGISPRIVRTDQFESVSIAQRLSWASNRTTTRVEDMAYSLLGILGINMPLIYGEGRAAFQRLQEEALKTKMDQSYLCWGLGMSCEQIPGGDSHLATSPAFFRNCQELHMSDRRRRYSFMGEMMLQSVTNQGLQIEIPVINIDKARGTILLLLPYGPGVGDICTAVPLLRTWGDSYFRRLDGSVPFAVPLELFEKAQKRKICILNREYKNFSIEPKGIRPKLSWRPSTRTKCDILVHFEKLLDARYRMTGYYTSQDTSASRDVSSIYFPPGVDWFFLEFTSGSSRVGVSFRGKTLRSRTRLKTRIFRIYRGPTLAVALSVQRLHDNRWSRKKWFDKETELEESRCKSTCTDVGHLHFSYEIEYMSPFSTKIKLNEIRHDITP